MNENIHIKTIIMHNTAPLLSITMYSDGWTSAKPLILANLLSGNRNQQ